MRQLAFIFPGQGSQSQGMLADFAADHPEIGETFAEASGVLGYDLWDLVQSDQSGKLNQTEFTQPALLTSSIALWRLWLERGGSRPVAVSGHSLGEYSALVASGVLEFGAAVGLVQKRGRYMQEAVPVGQGSMAAILGLDDAEVVRICEEVQGDGVVQAANFNSPGQVVIAGDNAAVQRAIVECRNSGAKKAMPLPVSAPFHCRLMEDAAARMTKELDQIAFRDPQIPIVQNVTARFASSVHEIKSNLQAQICSPVRWTESVQQLHASGITTLVECGPGRVLAGLVRRIEKSMQTLALGDKGEFAASFNEVGA